MPTPGVARAISGRSAMPSRTFRSLLGTLHPLTVVSSAHQLRNRFAKSMRKKKVSATELARKLGLHHSTVYRLRNAYPDSAPPFNETERWRQFCLGHLVSSEATTRLSVKAVPGRASSQYSQCDAVALLHWHWWHSRRFAFENCVFLNRNR